MYIENKKQFDLEFICLIVLIELPLASFSNLERFDVRIDVL